MDAASVPFTGLLGSLCASAGATRETLDPRRILDEFSARLEPVVPHDRLVIDVLEEDGRAFTVFAELLTLLATPVFYSLFDDAAERFTPRAWLAALARRWNGRARLTTSDAGAGG